MADENQKRVYEAMFVVDTGDAASWDDMTKLLRGILERQGAEIIGMTRWDERKLAFPIAKHKRATYVLSFFALESKEGLTEIERDCQLSEKVARVLIVRADQFTVADMRLQLGEDVNEEVAERVRTARGETLPLAEEEEEAAEGAEAQA